MTTDNLHISQSYAYAVARIRQAENGLLDRSRINRMLDVAAAGDVFRILGETEYAEAIDDFPSHAYERVLARELSRVYQFVSEFVPNRSIVDLFRMGHDLHNCKVAFRTYCLGTSGQGAWSSLGTVPASEVQQALSGDVRPDELPPHIGHLLRTGLDCLEADAGEIAPSDIPPAGAQTATSVDPQVLDMALDREHFANLLGLAEDLGNAFVIKLYRVRVDLANMTGFLRCRRLKRDRRFFRSFFIGGGTLPLDVFDEAYEEPMDAWVRKLHLSEYSRLIDEWAAEPGRDDRIAVLERLGRRYVLEFSKTSRYQFFGPEPIVAYLLSKESEVSDLRAIMVGKANGLEVELIRERLSGAYA